MQKLEFIALGTSHGDPTEYAFNTSSLFRFEDKNILIDAGAPVNALLIRKNIQPNLLDAVFITHAHEDHIGGLPGLLKSMLKKCRAEQFTHIFMPEEKTITAVTGFLDATHRQCDSKRVQFSTITPGRLWSGGKTQIRAFATGHLANEGFPSFGFEIISGETHIVYTGDLRHDFADFPEKLLKKDSILIMECTHYNLDTALERLKKLSLQKLIFTHIGNPYQGRENEENLLCRCEVLPYPVLVAHDGDSFML